MDKKLLDNKLTNKGKNENNDLKGFYERNRRDVELKITDGDTGQTQTHSFKTEGKYRYLENSKTTKQSFLSEKANKVDVTHTDRDLTKRFNDKPNKVISTTRTNLRCNTTNILNSKEETAKKTSGLRSIINLVNQVQNVIATKNESNYSLQNLYEKPKRKKMIRAKQSDVETAVASIKVSEVQMADSFVHRFKANCFPEENGNENNDNEKKPLGLTALRSQISRSSAAKEPDTLQRNALFYPAFGQRLDLVNMCLDTKRLNKEADPKKPSAVEKSKFRSKYTVLTETKPSGKLQQKDASREEVKHTVSPVNEKNNKGISKPDNVESKKKKPVINTVRVGKDDSKVYKAVTFEEKRKLMHLQIKIPNETQSKKSIPLKDVEPEKVSKNHGSNIHNSNKMIRGTNRPYSKRKKEQTRRVHPVVRSPSPATEVAKWAPRSDDAHSQPYYEAWVDTALTAVSNGNKDTYNKKIVQSFMKLKLMEDRAPTPELVYRGFDDEKYLGKITIRTKNTGSK